MKTTILLAFFVGTFSLGAGQIVAQCTCTRTYTNITAYDEFELAYAVFVGRVTELKKIPRDKDSYVQVVTFEVEKAWKHDLEARLTITNTIQGCLKGFEEKTEWLVYAYKDQDGKLGTYRCCSRTTNLSGAAEDLKTFEDAGKKPTKVLKPPFRGVAISEKGKTNERLHRTEVMAPDQNETRLPPDFATLQKVSREELKFKTDAHARVWGLDKITRWDLVQDSGNLVFLLPGGMKAVCPAQIIGTYNSEDHTWLWAWANPSIDEKLKVDSLKLRKYGEEHHIDRLTTRKWVGTEDDAWSMVALAVKLCGEQGAYRGPAGATSVYIAFGEIVLSKE